MNEFQTDQNRSEWLQSPFNYTHRDEFETNDTFRSSDSLNQKKSKFNQNNTDNNHMQPVNQFILSDNNFTLTEKIEVSNEQEKDDEFHTVNISITILASFPVDKEPEAKNDLTIIESSTRHRGADGPKPINFYKFEYQLTPDDPETFYSADLVTYKTAIKIFPDKYEPILVKGWENDNKLWATWDVCHEIKMNKQKLLKFFDHEIILKIWDSKDFCTPRTKFDKPKPFKFSRNENLDEMVKQSIMDQCEKYLKQIPIELHDKLDKKLPNQKKEEKEDLDDTEFSRLSNPQFLINSQIGNKLNELANDNEMNKHVKKKYTEVRQRNMSKVSKVSSSQLSSAKLSRLGRNRDKNKKELAAEHDHIKKNGITRIKLKTKTLFAGYKYHMVRLKDTVSTLDDCFISINLENDLMSEQQLFDLNPLMIKIQKCTDLPDKPINYEKLRDQCDKTYCCYKFFKQESYKTESIIQDKNLYFNDTNVYLTGLLNREELKEFLHQAPFEIEIHDRDRKHVPQSQPLKPCLFGNDSIDDHISSVNAVALKHTLYNPFETKDKRWDPYGVAKLNLYELVLGKKLLEFFVPVIPCVAPDVLGRNAQKSSSNTKNLNEDSPVLPGQYLDSNAHLYVKVTLAKPLFHQNLSKSQQILIGQKNCQFGKIVVKINSNNLNLIKSLISLIREINSNSLKLNQHSIKVQEAALSTYKLNEEEANSKYLDIITGFHLIDSRINLFVLEGIKNLGVKKIFESLPLNEPDCEILYNSDISFSKRLYSELDVEILKIKLIEPLESIVKKPLLYVRDMTPKASFDALIKLNQLFSEYKLRTAIRCELLPTSEMVLSMSKEYGIPLLEHDLSMFKSTENEQNKENLSPENSKLMNDFEFANQNTNIPHTSRIWTPIDNFNENFLVQKKEKEAQIKNYLSTNIENIHVKSELNRAKKPIKHYIQADSSFNYSSQALNSTELALDKFREYIKQNNPNKLYTYNPEFHNSSTFVPVNIKQDEKERIEESRNKWKSKEGWIFPDVKTSLHSNEHPRKLDQASLDRINEPWEENILHAYKMNSPLNRRFYTHDLRDKDFNVWSKPNVENKLPVTIFDSIDIREKLEKERQKEEKENWKKKLIVDNVDIKVHKLLGSTEMKDFGFNSSNQIDRLTGLLKSEPEKKGLLFKGVNFNNIPSLSVIKTEYEDKQTKFVNSKGFIAGSDKNLRITDDKNKIPVYYYDHQKYAKLKGKDFDSYGPVRSPVYKRSIELLNLENEKSNDLKAKMFIIPDKTDIEQIDNLKNVSRTNFLIS